MSGAGNETGRGAGYAPTGNHRTDAGAYYSAYMVLARGSNVKRCAERDDHANGSPLL